MSQNVYWTIQFDPCITNRERTAAEFERYRPHLWRQALSPRSQSFSLILMPPLFLFLLFHSGMQFSTKDQDNDLRNYSSCAVKFKGAWWHNKCHTSNLNGQYLGGHHKSYADGINWEGFRRLYYSLKRSEMKLRLQQWQTLIRFLHEDVRVERHQFSSKYLRLNNNLKYFPRYDIYLGTEISFLWSFAPIEQRKVQN